MDHKYLLAFGQYNTCVYHSPEHNKIEMNCFQMECFQMHNNPFGYLFSMEGSPMHLMDTLEARFAEPGEAVAVVQQAELP